SLELVEEKKKRSARLPEDHLLLPAFQELESVLTREPFTDSVWLRSCEQLVRVAVSLASCVKPFADNPHLPLEHAEALSLVVR
ncbi:unnamed protein product, partial [Laminaria digitata]